MKNAKRSVSKVWSAVKIMSGILFNKDGATRDKIISKDSLYLIIKALKLKEFADSQNNEAINVADRHAEANFDKTA